MALRDAPLPDEATVALPGVSIAEAAVQLGVSVHAVRRLVRSGRLASMRLARPQGWVVRVLLDEDHVAPRSDPPRSAPPPPPSATRHVALPGARSHNELVDVLKAQVGDLQQRLNQ